MKRMLKKLLGTSDFAKNLLALVTGTALAQVINFAFSTFLTRLYTPGDFGAISVFSSIVSFVLVISCAKFDVAIVAAKNDKDAAKLFSLSFLITVLVSVLTVVAAFIVYFFSIDMYKDSPVHDWLYLMPLSVLFLTGGQVLWMWNVRNKNFKNISAIRVIEALSAGAFAVLFHKMGPLGLLLSMLVSQLVSFGALGWMVMNEGAVQTKEPLDQEIPDKRTGLSKFSFPMSELRTTFSAYKEFPRVNILQGFVDIFQVNAIVLFLSSAAFNGDVIGYYALCMRVLQVPMRLIVLPVSHVFFAEASELYRKGGDLYALVKKTIYRTAIFALPVPLVLVICGPWLFSLVFGANWNEAGVYAQIIAGWIFLDLVRAPIAQVASITGKQRYVLYLSIVSNLILAGVLYYGIHFALDARWIFGLVALSQGIMTFFLILLILNISKTPTHNSSLNTPG